VPPQDHASGAQRPLYVYRTAYPATVTSIRGDTWHPDNLEGSPEQKALWGKESTVEGYIPEVIMHITYVYILHYVVVVVIIVMDIVLVVAVVVSDDLILHEIYDSSVGIITIRSMRIDSTLLC
jgi:hypothetical protein